MSSSFMQYRVAATGAQDFPEVDNDIDAERRWMYNQCVNNFIHQRSLKRKLRTGQLLFMLCVLMNAVVCYKYWSGPSTDAPVPELAYCDALDRQKCENGGLLINTASSFVCKCTPNFYGERCSHALAHTYVENDVDKDMRRGAPNLWLWFWPFTTEEKLKPTVSFFQDHLKRIKDGLSVDDSENGLEHTRAGAITRSRVLPPNRPSFCPEDKSLPPTDVLYKEIFQRKPDGFVRDTKRQNVLSYAFYQFFVLQFFDAEPNSAVTGSQLYGTGEKAQNALRSFSDGKLKTEVVNGEQYPPRLSLGEKIKAAYSRSATVERSQWYNRLAAGDATDNTLWSVITDIFDSSLRPQWATGHSLLSSNHLLFTMSTLWVREHNRVCDELVKQWPTWTDSEVYNIAKNIVLAQMMRIMLNDVLVVQNLKYEPETFQDYVENTKSFGTPFELLLTTVLPSGVPDMLGNVKMHSMLSNDNSHVLEYGVSNVIRRMIDEKMGEVISNNDGVATEPLTKFLMKLSRQNAVQSFNNYRRHLGLTAYGSFYELTENWDTANALELLYGNVDNVELLTGMLTEKRYEHVVPTFTVMTKSFIINSILTNSLGHSYMWKPKTFGGDFGFNLVKSANMKTFICNNLVDGCDDDFSLDVE